MKTERDIKILGFSGSSRKNSWNKMLLKIALQGALSAGATITLVDLKEYNLPIYDQDFEAENGIPQKALELKKCLQDHDGFIITSPEYNSGYSALLKNAIDWASRASEDNEAPLSAYKNKVATLLAASPGGLGGIRGLYQLRELLMNMSMIVNPNMRAVGFAGKEFKEDGSLNNLDLEKAILGLGKQTYELIEKMK